MLISMCLMVGPKLGFNRSLHGGNQLDWHSDEHITWKIVDGMTFWKILYKKAVFIMSYVFVRWLV